MLCEQHQETAVMDRQGTTRLNVWMTWQGPVPWPEEEFTTSKVANDLAGILWFVHDSLLSVLLVWQALPLIRRPCGTGGSPTPLRS